MFKGHICKSKFHVCYHFFLDICENPGRKTFINPSSPKHPEIIEIKNDIDFLFSPFFVVLQNGFIFLRHQKEV